MTRSRLLAIAAGFLVAAGAAGQVSDVYVFTGVANVSTWQTRYQASNGRDAESFVTFFEDSRLPGPCPPSSCGELNFTLSPNATSSIEPVGEGITTVFALVAPESPVSVRARTFPTDASIDLSFDVPSIRLSTLQAAEPNELIFPVRQDVGGRSNLALASIHAAAPAPIDGDPIHVRIEAFSSTGQSRGTTEVAIPDGGTIYLVRLLETMGLAELDGQVRVTKLSGGPSLMWGVMYQINADGQTSSTPGLIP